jgi:hypothetical protein
MKPKSVEGSTALFRVNHVQKTHPLSPETHDSRPPLSLTDYARVGGAPLASNLFDSFAEHREYQF